MFVGNPEGVRTIYPENLHVWDKYTIKTTYKWNKYNTASSLKPVAGLTITAAALSYYDANYVSTTISVVNASSLQLNSPSSANYINNMPTGYYIGNLTYESKHHGYVAYFTGGTSGATALYYTKGSDSVTEYSVQTVYSNGGTLIEGVTSDTSSTYPKSGKSGSYWYESTGTENSAGEYIETIYSTNPSLYPSSAEQDGYWYTRIK